MLDSMRIAFVNHGVSDQVCFGIVYINEFTALPEIHITVLLSAILSKIFKIQKTDCHF